MVNLDASCLQKQAYETRRDAEWAFKSYKAHAPFSKRVRHMQYPYKCPHCGKWT